MTIRLAHFSDVHLTSPKLGWKRHDVLSKKVTGWINVRWLGRGKRFRHAPTVVAAMIPELKTRGFDALVFSGDATKLAFDSEMKIAAERLGVNDATMPPAIAVPGNHDYYVRNDVRMNRFESNFTPWLEGQRIDDHRFPFARRVGHCWIIALNSAKANFLSIDASGRVGREQLARFQELCRSLSPGPRILVTHYPLRKANGKMEIPTRRLRDHRQVLAAAIESGISLWLHGHIHRGYVLEATPEIPFPVICSGSATQTDRWSYNEYTIEGWNLTLAKRTFNLEKLQFAEVESRTVEMRRGEG
ncbi:MAG: metallophosphoesterase [Gemmataceae bacterium]